MLLLREADEKLHARQKPLRLLQLLEDECELPPGELYHNDVIRRQRRRRHHLVPMLVLPDDAVDFRNADQRELDDSPVRLIEVQCDQVVEHLAMYVLILAARRQMGQIHT